MGVDAIMLKEWLLRHGAHSEALREEFGYWVYWLSNQSPPYAAYRALNAVRELAGNKKPGVRPIGCGEIFMRLFADCDHDQSKGGATVECGNTQLCAGLPSGIEANLHAVRAIWPQSAGWTHDNGVEEDERNEEDDDMPEEDRPVSVRFENPHVDPGAAEDDRYSRFEEDTGFGSGIFDAENAFNKLNRYLMLWTVGHRWAKGGRFTFNRYRHWAICIVRDKPGNPPIVIHSKEGITQGDCRAMSVYGVALMPLAEKMAEEVPGALQPWYADDSAACGTALDNAKCLEFLIREGPKYGYHPVPAKSWYICKAEDEEDARLAFSSLGLQINFTNEGKRYLGGFIGSGEGKKIWLGEMVEKWVAAVETLAIVAEKYPQTAYVGFTISLQNEWQYVQRVVSDTASFFAPLEQVIRNKFIPALIGIAASEVDGELRSLLSHSVKKSGLAIRNPVDTAEHVHETSKAATSYLVRSMIDSNVEFDIKEHRSLATEECARARQKRLKREQELLDERSQRSHAIGRRDERNKQNGCWLTVIPLRVNGTDLSANEFRDNIRLRYNFAPLDMPQHCDGCGAKMTVEHALQCKVGGLVHARHDDVADEFRDMCGQALSFSKVEREPRIYSGVSQRNRVERGDASAGDGSNTQNNNTAANNVTEERGDAGCQGFWNHRRMAVFDVRITDTDSRSNRNKDPDKILAQHEKEKKNKYLRPCLEQRRDFTPLVYSVDGLAGREARAAEKRLAYHLSAKWKKDYPTMVHYVRVRMALSVVKANSLLIRGSRERQRPRRPYISDRFAMYDWQTWSEW